MKWVNIYVCCMTFYQFTSESSQANCGFEIIISKLGKSKIMVISKSSIQKNMNDGLISNESRIVYNKNSN